MFDFDRLLGWYTMYTFWGLLPLTKFCHGYKLHFAPKSCVLLYWQRYCTALEQQASAKICGMLQGMELRNFRRGCHLYSAGRSSRWLSVHMLVMAALCNRGAIIFFPVISIFYRLSIFFFPRLISAATDWISTILLHMAWP